jgi:hypothetical protein
MFVKDKMKKMSDSEKKAKMTALKEAHGMASDMLKGNLQGVKKVTVAAKSKPELEKGLDMAKKLVDHSSDSDESEESDAEELGESQEEESAEYSPEIPEDCDTEDEIDALIAKLEEKKRSLKA